jgi:hypothetical protein
MLEGSNIGLSEGLKVGGNGYVTTIWSARSLHFGAGILQLLVMLLLEVICMG